MNKYYISILFLLFVNHFSFAQNKDIEAKLHFTKAQDLYDQGGIENYMEALKEVETAEKLLDGPNLKTLYLKILAMHSASIGYYFAYQKKEALEKFFDLVKSAPDYPVEKYNDILFLQEVTKELAEIIRSTGKYEKVFTKGFNDTKECLEMEAGLYRDLFFTDSTKASINERQRLLEEINQRRILKEEREKKLNMDKNPYEDPNKYRGKGMKRLAEKANKQYEYERETKGAIGDMFDDAYDKVSDIFLKPIEIKLQQSEYAKRCVYWKKQLALQNDTVALDNLSYYYAHGLGVLPNRQLAIGYKLQQYKLQQLNVGTAIGIGQLYENRPIIDLNWTPDYNKAIEWYKRAFNLTPDTLYAKDIAWYIGKKYADNFTYPNAQAKLDAVKPWYELAGGAGLQQLGRLYYSEHPSGKSRDAIEKDNITAIEYYKKAADNNAIGAIDALAIIYETGAPGIKKDKGKAKEYRAKVEALKKPK
ncbi:MAG: sel1 repeat family protein [Chitinophagaceae bacterium]|nr:sel1 repeat family protein [Chitinophagaceae bacterium]MCW5926500.1 sel1 repeat family protein [Chitinophagaceae bacterium]